ncbi:indigoidine synthase A-like protein [Irpex rosettiformis]|uniref:Indigoidine synthase A-like protein n=1 Tax=Irpex rosettiformis TaxID=378272 RepID=A0ACB8UKK0_9APHY|nr:indigoidine synthase A-like protein [Irpex rosettiformis]
MNAPIDVHPEVQQALAKKAPVVALETTIVTHGMPQPTNLDTAKAVESIVRAQGAIPATIGIIQGRVKIGLENHELEYLADIQNTPVFKTSRRDLGPVLALQRNGGTTCSTTLIFAAMAGIKVFATGGLGGVHRGGEHTLDISADLPELSRCPVGLVSAGVKSILDIGRTLEYLETLGVPVVSYGADEFPAFYSRDSGFKSPWRIDDPRSAARVLHSQAQLGLSNGAIFAVPIPEKYEAVGAELQVAVEQALQEAEANGVNRRGKEATPWLLKRVGEITGGKSLASNVALIKNTARVGSQIAVAYANLVKDAEDQPHIPSFGVSGSSTPNSTIESIPPLVEEKDTTATADLVVVGCTALDVTSKANSTIDAALSSQSTVPGMVQTSLGGVGRNMTEAAYRLLSLPSHTKHDKVVLVSPIGQDVFGRMLVEETTRIGMRSDGLSQMEGQRSAVCNMVVDANGDLISGVADMTIIQAFTGAQAVDAIKYYKPTIVAIDGNLLPEAIESIVKYCYTGNIKIFFEPTSVTKSQRILPAISSIYDQSNRPPISYVSPNLLELSQLYRTASSDPYDLIAHSKWWSAIDSMSLSSEFRMDLEHLARRNTNDNGSSGTLEFITENGVAQMGIHLLPFFQHIVLKCGQRGVLTIFQTTAGAGTSGPWTQESTNLKQRQVVARGKDGCVIVIKHYPAIALAQDEMVNVTGAGDTLVGSLLASLVQNFRTFESPLALDETITRAQKAAIMTLKSSHAVSPLLSNL